jgi:hypothetical protein
MHENIIEANRQRDVHLEDGRNAYYIPQGWCDEWSVTGGSTGGLDYINDKGVNSPEIYCYVYLRRPTFVLDTMFVEVADLQKMREMTREEQTANYPHMYQLLEQLERKDTPNPFMFEIEMFNEEFEVMEINRSKPELAWLAVIAKLTARDKDPARLGLKHVSSISLVR